MSHASPIAAAGYSPEGGALYEPRGFWSVARYVTTTTTPQPEYNVQKLSREHFRNGARWPIVLTRLALAPIGNQLTRIVETAVTVGNASTVYHNDGCNLGLAEVMVTAPYRQNYSRHFVFGRGLAPRPTDAPSMEYAPDLEYASSIWGLSRMKFDRPLVLPNKGMLEIGVGNFRAPNAVTFGAGPSNCDAWINVEQRGGMWGGNSRLKDRTIGPVLDPTTMPWGADAWGTGAGNIAGVIPQTGIFSANDFLKQNASVGGAGGNVFDAINVLIDQIDTDDAYQASIVDGVAGSPVSPLALNVPCSVRTRGGGTSEYWWRPNAPLALMFNELTPAHVYDLPEPITLGPGDCLEISIRLPTVATVSISGNQTTVDSTYQIGCAFTGFAVIEG